MNENVTELRTDAAKADAYRTEMTPILDQLVAIIGRARGEGLVISFQIGPDQYGRSVVQNIAIVKPL